MLNEVDPDVADAYEAVLDALASGSRDAKVDAALAWADAADAARDTVAEADGACLQRLAEEYVDMYDEMSETASNVAGAVENRESLDRTLPAIGARSLRQQVKDFAKTYDTDEAGRMSAAFASNFCFPSTAAAPSLPAVHGAEAVPGIRIGTAKVDTRSGWTIALVENTGGSWVDVTTRTTFHDKNGRKVITGYESGDLLPPHQTSIMSMPSMALTFEPKKAKVVKSARMAVTDARSRPAPTPSSNATLSAPVLLIGSKSVVGTAITNNAAEDWLIGVQTVVMRGDRIVAWGGTGSLRVDAGETISAAMGLDAQVQPGDVAYVSILERQSQPF